MVENWMGFFGRSWMNWCRLAATWLWLTAITTQNHPITTFYAKIQKIISLMKYSPRRLNPEIHELRLIICSKFELFDQVEKMALIFKDQIFQFQIKVANIWQLIANRKTFRSF